MDEIETIPWNGFTVVSTFAGCGGSSLGYRMAGFRVLWANEIDSHARQCYSLNSDAIIDSRDICNVRSNEILENIGLNQGELDVLDGSPPCQGFSTAGKRVVSDKRNNLFFEFARLLEGLQPKIFVAENVSGLVKGSMKGIFLDVLARLKKCGYQVKCKVLDAQWLGVPQTRQRAIFIGVRSDLEKQPEFPKPLTYRFSVGEAIPWIHKAIHDESGRWSLGNVTTRQAPALRTRQHLFVECQKGIRRRFTIDEAKRICSFPNDFKLVGPYDKQWKRLGNSVPPIMMRAIAEIVRDNILVAGGNGGRV